RRLRQDPVHAPPVSAGSSAASPWPRLLLHPISRPRSARRECFSGRCPPGFSAPPGQPPKPPPHLDFQAAVHGQGGPAPVARFCRSARQPRRPIAASEALPPLSAR